MLPFRDHNPSRTFPVVTIALIVLNVLVFAYMLSLQAQGEGVLNAFVTRMAVIPAELTGEGPATGVAVPEWLTIITAMFMHGGYLHIASNMLYLWIFGNNIEDTMGSGRFLVFYLLCGVIATLVYVVSAPDSTIPSLGASGAIAGVLGAYLVRFPRAQVDTCVFFVVVFLVRLPALIVLATWFITQLFNGIASLGIPTAQEQGGVAYWAHIGGFLAGMILVSFFAKRRQTRYRSWEQ